jgi:hypothetical protein
MFAWRSVVYLKIQARHVLKSNKQNGIFKTIKILKKYDCIFISTYNTLLAASVTLPSDGYNTGYKKNQSNINTQYQVSNHQTPTKRGLQSKQRTKLPSKTTVVESVYIQWW